MTLLRFFEVFSGPTALLLSLIATAILAYKTGRQRHPRVRRAVAPLLLWPPIVLAFFMVMHIGHNSFNAYVSISEGQAIFAFYHYGLLLFGGTVGTQAVLLLRETLRHLAGPHWWNPRLLFHMGRIVATTLPTFIFTPIGIIPTILMVLAAIFFIFAHRFPARQTGAKPTKVRMPGKEAVPA